MNKKIFKFNERNVCLNPDAIRINDYVTIEIAECDGVWISGSHYGFKHMYYGSPCMKGNVNFPTRIESLKNEIDRLIRRIKADEVRNKDSELHRLWTWIYDYSSGVLHFCDRVLYLRHNGQPQA